MPNKPKVKVCGITREADAELALELGADYLGIILFERSPRAVDPSRLEALFTVIPEGKRVLVDVNSGTDTLGGLVGRGFDFCQIHCLPEIAMSTLAGWSGIVGPERLWLAPKVPPADPFPQATLEFADTIVYDSVSQDPLLFGGTGETSDWERFQEWSTLYGHKQWILAGGLKPENIAAALEATTPDIVDVNSGVESAPGKKDPARLRALFDSIS